MARDQMRYDQMVETALRGVVQHAIRQAASEGLPGEHHFYITFRTGHPGVDIADYLRDRYPSEMTIVLQHQFYGLEVFEDRFEVTLSFNGMPERLRIPFGAISIFADPSVNFALQFQAGDNEDAAPPMTGNSDMDVLQQPHEEAAGASTPDDESGDSEKKTGEVVSLDQFRRK